MNCGFRLDAFAVRHLVFMVNTIIKPLIVGLAFAVSAISYPAPASADGVRVSAQITLGDTQNYGYGTQYSTVRKPSTKHNPIRRTVIGAPVLDVHHTTQRPSPYYNRYNHGYNHNPHKKLLRRAVRSCKRAIRNQIGVYPDSIRILDVNRFQRRHRQGFKVLAQYRPASGRLKILYPPQNVKCVARDNGQSPRLILNPRGGYNAIRPSAYTHYEAPYRH